MPNSGGFRKIGLHVLPDSRVWLGKVDFIVESAGPDSAPQLAAAGGTEVDDLTVPWPLHPPEPFQPPRRDSGDEILTRSINHQRSGFG